MLLIGRTQELTVVKIVDFGVYLAEDGSDNDERVLLPKKQVPEGTVKGSKLNVFLYKDSSDRLISTINTPLLQLNQVAALKVAAVSRIGAFLNWGLEKDLFLPFKEQTCKVQEGDEVLVALYLDKSSRLCATMRIYPYLKQNPPYSIGDMVTARVIDINPKFGIFIAVEDSFSGLIQKKDAQGCYKIGDKLIVRVVQIREDGRIDASPKQKAYLQLGDDAEMIYKKISSMGGTLPFNDKADPQVINDCFGLSKAAFKRAVGNLLKNKRITIGENSIKIN